MGIVSLKKVFWLLVALFILIVGYFVIPASDEVKRALFPFAATLAFLFFFLGILLVMLVRKQRVQGKLKIFLYLTGLSATFFLLGSILHNFFYAIGVAFEHIKVVVILMEILHVTFFLIATIGCPIGFLVGMIGGVILMKKESL